MSLSLTENHPSYTWTNILMALALITTLAGTSITAYISVRNDIADLKYSVETQLASHEVRLTNDERAVEQSREDEKAFAVEMRTDLSAISQQIADLRVALVTSGTLPRKH